MKFFNKKHKNKKTSQAGFTMIEMLTVLAIFTILTGITVYNYGRFNNNVIITNLAYEIALSVREAQVFSLGVRGADVEGVENPFETRYGVFFDLSDSENGFDNFVFFADVNESGNCELNPNDSSSSWDSCILSSVGCYGECQNVRTLTKGIEITKICVAPVGLDPMDDEGNCTGDGESVDSASVTFERPNPDALVFADGSSFDSDSNQYRNISILLEAPNGPKRIIDINDNGQISVENIDIGQ